MQDKWNTGRTDDDRSANLPSGSINGFRIPVSNLITIKRSTILLVYLSLVCFNDALFIYFYVSLSAKEMQTLTLNSETSWTSNADLNNTIEKPCL